MTTQKSSVNRVVTLTAAAFIVAMAGAFAYTRSAATTVASVPVAGVNTSKVAAVVNGSNVYDSELVPGIQQGADRAVVIDRYINKVLAAELARSNYSKDATEALKGAEREVLSQLYVAKKTEELRAGVTEAGVKAYYDANIKVEDFAGYKVKFMIAGDEKDATDVAAAIAAGKAKDVESRFKNAKDGADGFVMAGELPYGLGNVVRSLKKGEYSRPVVMRNGYFILYLDDVKANPKPELSVVSAEIKNVMVAKQLNDTLTTARGVAKVELR